MACSAMLLTLVFLATSGVHSAVVRDTHSAFLASDDSERMRPDIVARTLATVEQEWRSQASVFVDCSNSSADGKVCKSQALAAFTQSCTKVVDAIVQGSDGDRDNAKEYMSNVCSQSVLVGWQKTSCTELTTDIIDHSMNANNFANRRKSQSGKICTNFWSKFVEGEEERKHEEELERAEQEKKAAEAAEVAKKKAEEEAAAAKKIADEQAKAEEARLAEEKALQEKVAKEQHEAEVKREAEEAKARAAEAAQRLAEKKAEAERMQREAKEKLDEAERAEAEHKAALEEHKRAQELLHNATHAAGNVSVNVTVNVSSNATVLVSHQNSSATNMSKVEAVTNETNASQSQVSK